MFTVGSRRCFNGRVRPSHGVMCRVRIDLSIAVIIALLLSMCMISRIRFSSGSRVWTSMCCRRRIRYS